VAALVVIVSTFGIATVLFMPGVAALFAPAFVVGIEGNLWTLYGIALIGIGCYLTQATMSPWTHTVQSVIMLEYR